MMSMLDSGTVLLADELNTEQLTATLSATNVRPNEPRRQYGVYQRYGSAPQATVTTSLVWLSLAAPDAYKPEVKRPQMRIAMVESAQQGPLAPSVASTSFELALTLARIKQLPALIDRQYPDWAAVAPATLDLAQRFIVSLGLVLVRQGAPWVTPHVASDGQGAVTFEWWNQARTLTIYVEPDGTVSYLASWGTHLWDEMEEANNPPLREWVEVWEWLYAQKVVGDDVGSRRRQ